MGFEPTTLCLGSKYSTTELHPPVYDDTKRAAGPCQRIMISMWYADLTAADSKPTTEENGTNTFSGTAASKQPSLGCRGPDCCYSAAALRLAALGSMPSKIRSRAMVWLHVE